jgi:hypothetical protein
MVHNVPYRAIALLLAMMAALAGLTWTIVRTATERVLYEDSIATVENWARYLADNVTDLRQIAKTANPSRRSLIFFEQAARSGGAQCRQLQQFRAALSTGLQCRGLPPGRRSVRR